MTPNEYQSWAMRTEADQETIRQRIYSYGVQATRLENAARGLCDDSGELSSAVKKWLEYGKPLDKTNVKEEIGDCLYRLAQACEAVGVTLEEAMEANIAKLKIRYPEKFTEELAAEEGRDRAKEREALDGVLKRAQERLKAWDKLATPTVVDVDGRKMINNMLWECLACGHLNRKVEEKCVSCSNQ